MLSLWQNVENSVCVIRLTETTEIEELVCLFEEVAQEENWEPDKALRLYQDRSIYFALQVEGQIAGGLQLVLPGSGSDLPLPCQALWPEVPVVPPVNRRAHVSVLALDAAFRGQSNLFWILVVEMWRYCVGEGIATLFIEVTPRVLPLYQRLGWPLQIRGERKIHWGEECYLCTLGIGDVAQALLLRAEHSHYYQQIVAQAFRVTLPKPSERTMREYKPVPAVPVAPALPALS